MLSPLKDGKLISNPSPPGTELIAAVMKGCKWTAIYSLADRKKIQEWIRLFSGIVMDRVQSPGYITCLLYTSDAADD